MRNIIRSLSCTLLAICTVFMFASAEERSLTKEDVFETATTSIDAPDSIQFNVAQPLYNLADNQVAFMYYLQSQGYIIADDCGRVLEYNLDGDHHFFTDPDEHYYYGGITCYMIKEGSKIIDLITGEPIIPNINVRSNSNANLLYIPFSG